MGIEREFQSYGAQLVNRAWAVSAITDDPREVVVSIWQHNIVERDGRWIYDDSLARWNGAGKNLLKEHLGVAYREGLRLRAVVATQHNRAERERNPDKAPRNTFKARPDWVGRVELLDGDHFVLVFEHVGELATAPTGAKYWRVAEAVEAMGGGTLAEVGEWLETHFPSDPIADLRANLEHLTVNSPSRPHYNYSRSDWRTDRGHPHDRLFKIVDAGPPRSTRYVPFNPAVHGHLDLQKGDDGKWVVVPLAQDDQTRAEAQGQADAFDHAPPLDNEHDARVWAMRAVAQRRGQPLFRARLLDAYEGKCTITGCSALEVLEAAHVLPYRGDHTNRVDNGLLLRADLHTLFDCQLLWITAENTLALAPTLLATDYASLQGQPLRLPASSSDHPNPAHLAAAEAKLAVKETKTALNEQRIAGNKIKQMRRWIEDAKRTRLEPEKDNRIFPDWYVPVLISENGRKVVRPMRYHCRPAGMDPSIDWTKDGRVSGTYNARRDNLQRFWRNQFGYTHGLMLAETFYENVDDGKGGSKEIQFRPRTGETMYIACLYSHWVDPKGEEPDLWSFAAITDEPEPEVAAAGHDRTIINIKPEHVDAWLNPDPNNLEALFAIFDDKRHPYYELVKEAA